MRPIGRVGASTGCPSAEMMAPLARSGACETRMDPDMFRRFHPSRSLRVRNLWSPLTPKT